MSQHELNALCEDMKKYFSKEGFEVASLGTESLQVKTPGVIYNLGMLLDQIEALNENAVVDVTCENGQLELFVSLPSQSGATTSSGLSKGRRPEAPLLVYVLALIIVCMAAFIFVTMRDTAVPFSNKT